jgi:hypothetical protein
MSRVYISTWRRVGTFAFVSAAGFIGAATSNFLGMNSVRAASSQIVRGSRIELVDEAGKLGALLDFDPAKRPRLRIFSNDNTSAIEMGVAGNEPFVVLNGRDGRQRVALRIRRTGKPVFQMGDLESQSKIVLGSVEADAPSPDQDTWALEFNKAVPFRPVAGINMSVAKPGQKWRGSVFIVDSDGRLWNPFAPIGIAPR